MTEKDNTNDSAFLAALKRGDSLCIRQIYEKAFPVCLYLVTNNQGTIDDAKDLFQEALLVLIQKAKAPDFELRAQVKTYLYAIVRNLWLKQLRQKSKNNTLLLIDEPDFQGLSDIDGIESLELKKENEERHEDIEQALKMLPEECKKIVTAFYFQKLSLKEIADWLDYSDNFIKVKKKRCMDKLKELVIDSKPIK